MGEGIIEGFRSLFAASRSERTKPTNTILGIYNLGKLALADQLLPELTRDFLEMEATLRRKQTIGRSGGIDITSEYRLVPIVALQRVKDKYVMDYYMEWRDKDGKPSVKNTVYGQRKNISGFASRRLQAKLAKYDEFDPENP
jgi:hypothetical protein